MSSKSLPVTRGKKKRGGVCHLSDRIFNRIYTDGIQYYGGKENGLRPRVTDDCRQVAGKPSHARADGENWRWRIYYSILWWYSASFEFRSLDQRYKHTEIDIALIDDKGLILFQKLVRLCSKVSRERLCTSQNLSFSLCSLSWSTILNLPISWPLIPVTTN